MQIPPADPFYAPAVEPDFTRSRFQLAANLHAIEVLNQLKENASTSPLAPEDAEALARYGGWGGLSVVFDEESYTTRESREKLKALVEPAVYAQLQASTLNAFYTPHALTRSIWEAVTTMGFESGRVLEPGCGTGSFIGTMPTAMRAVTKTIGVECEPISAGIAKALYGSADTRIMATPYERAPIASASIDLVIGNVPFGGYQIHDPALNNEGFLIHDYFLLKSLMLMRPGGLMAVITSIGTLDKSARAIREKMYEQVDLVAAVRLPTECQKASANCTVSTDLLFFRKRLPGEQPGSDDWLSTKTVDLTRLNAAANRLDVDPASVQVDPASSISLETARVNAIDESLQETVRVNAIFAPDGRGHVLGSWLVNRQYGVGRAMVSIGSEVDFASVCPAIVRAVPTGIFTSREAAEEHRTAQIRRTPETQEVEVGAFSRNQIGHYVVRGTVLGQLLPTEDHTLTDAQIAAAAMKASQGIVLKQAVFTPLEGAPLATIDRIRLMIPLRDALLDSLALQQAGADDVPVKAAQKRALDAYQAFTKQFGAINQPKNLAALRDDPDASLVCAAETYDDKTRTGKPAEVFHVRTLGPLVRDDPTVVMSPLDALVGSMDQFGRINQGWMAARAQMEWTEVRAALGSTILLDPTRLEFEPAYQVLSGDVREKLQSAELAMSMSEVEHQAELRSTVEALKGVLPGWKSLDVIYIHPGAAWVTTDMIKSFVEEIIYPGHKINVQYSPHNASWALGFEDGKKSSDWDVDSLKALELFERVLNSRSTVIYHPTDKANGGSRVVDKNNSELAAKRATRMIETFSDWLPNDPLRKHAAEEGYNTRFNGFVAPRVDASLMTFPTLSKLHTMRPFQPKAIARAVFGHNMLFPHPVGAGKTLMAIGLAVKIKECGLGRKTLISVKKNTLVQFERASRAFFPASRVLTIQLSDLNAKGREGFFRKLQTHNPDIILVTPEVLQRLSVPKSFETAFIQREIGELGDALSHEHEVAVASGSKSKKSLTIKAIQERLKKAESSFERMLTVKDSVRFTLADLGVDCMIIDEAHNFKRLSFISRQQILGIPNGGSKRASDLLMKVRYLQSEQKRVVMMTGTPFTNTLCEVFTMQTYLQPELLKKAGIQHFDAWSRTFAKVVTGLEPDPGSGSYREVSRLAEMNNVPELIYMLAQTTETVADADLNLIRPTPTFTVHSVPPTELQADYRQLLAVRTRIARMQGTPEIGMDNILTILNDSRRASLDLRAVFPKLPEYCGVGNKLTEVAAAVHETYLRTRDTRGTQLVFCDLATPGSAVGFNAYKTLKDHMIQLGMPAAEVAFVHDAKNDIEKDRLFDRVRQGSVAVLIGSTEKMGEGTNVQERLKALHHVTAPYHPGAVIQRNGRIVRWGNENPQVEIRTWVTQGLLEDWNWHLVLLKEKFIRQVMDVLGHRQDAPPLARSIAEDVATMGYAEIESAAAGNPMVKEKYDLDLQIDSASRLIVALEMRERSLKNKGYNEIIEKNRLNVEIPRIQRAIEKFQAAGLNREAAATFTLDKIDWQPGVLKDSWAKTARALIEEGRSKNQYSDYRRLLGTLGPFLVCLEAKANESDIRMVLINRNANALSALKFAQVIAIDSHKASVSIRIDPHITTLRLRDWFNQAFSAPERLSARLAQLTESIVAFEQSRQALQAEIKAEDTKRNEAADRLVEVSKCLAANATDPLEIDDRARAFVVALQAHGYSISDILKPSTAAQFDFQQDARRAETDEGDDDHDDHDDDHKSNASRLPSLAP